MLRAPGRHPDGGASERRHRPDRLNQHVGGYRIEVTEPLHKLRVILEETEGMAVDLTWDGLVPRRAGAATRAANRHPGHA